MLNLELLEKKLDEVLAKETSETMTSWLLSRRLKKYISLLGEGEVLNMPTNTILVSQSKSFTVESNIKEFSTEYTDNEYLFAA
ncbi:MAG: hypothetical protein QM564_12050 [Bergeyella sp.]